MPSVSNLLTLTAILALTVLPNTVSAKKNLRKKRNLRRKEINGIAAPKKGIEEDVEFFTNMARRTQAMSVPTVNPPTDVDPPVMSPSLPPQANKTPPPVNVETGPPVSEATAPPVGTGTGPPVPVSAIVCDSGETCVEAGTRCSDGTTETCCGETFDSFVCECSDDLTYVCFFSDACLDPQCGTEPPVSGPTPVTPSPVPPPALGFNCPPVSASITNHHFCNHHQQTPYSIKRTILQTQASLVGCTALDLTDPQDECPTVGEPCAGATDGEFCCRDGCPRNYCTAKQAPAKRSVPITTTTASPTPRPILPFPNDWEALLDDMETRSP